MSAKYLLVDSWKHYKEPRLVAQYDSLDIDLCELSSDEDLDIYVKLEDEIPVNKASLHTIIDCCRITEQAYRDVPENNWVIVHIVKKDLLKFLEEVD